MSAMTKPEKQGNDLKPAEQGYGTCGATHGDCPNTWKGTCDRESGHDGAHHCSSCNGLF